MNPNVEQSGLHLPQPSFEAAPPTPGQGSSEQVNTAAPEQAITPSLSMPPVQPTTPARPVVTTATPSPVTPAQAGQPPAVASPAIADDTDLIEKEWVVRAKRIVEKARNDPYMQTKEIHRFKADYMKKRYNKELKTTEG